MTTKKGQYEHAIETFITYRTTLMCPVNDNDNDEQKNTLMCNVDCGPSANVSTELYSYLIVELLLVRKVKIETNQVLVVLQQCS